ncbi:hypothetical protein HL653_20950 [Sphingomonas sp. AP4-R1]|uniref:hypothetical protein n=1 Tax=Sphingomonas sp. AP4-R1 TaxID=2735134 RepID=UPI001493528E|nr:hypothetical protein [Sphingomonas sp. AP4-R1]QJU59881.1 hypothetical protein HL653_20950 [Sphingomonas sp. AP4-R1]
MMDFTEAQAQVVRTVAASADVGPWRRLLANVEILEHADDFQVDYICLAVVAGGDDLETRQFQLSDDAQKAVTAFYRQRRDDADETIGGFELAIDPDGRFRFDIDHGEPKRINGVWDEAREGRLDNYLEHYKAELAAHR